MPNQVVTHDEVRILGSQLERPAYISPNVFGATAAPLALVLGWKGALFWVGAFISTLLHLASACAFAWAIRPLLRGGHWFLPTLAFLVQPAVLAVFQFGRADHHGFLILVFILQWGLVLRCALNRHDHRTAILAGCMAGFGI